MLSGVRLGDPGIRRGWGSHHGGSYSRDRHGSLGKEAWLNHLSLVGVGLWVSGLVKSQHGRCDKMGIMKLLTVAVHSCFLCQRSNFFSSILWVPVFVYPKKSPSSNSEKSVLNHTVRVWRNVDETLTGHVWLAGEELGGRPWRPLASLVIMWRFGPQTELDEVDVFSLSPVVAWDLKLAMVIMKMQKMMKMMSMMKILWKW